LVLSFYSQPKNIFITATILGVVIFGIGIYQGKS